MDDLRKASSRLDAAREIVADLLRGAQPGEGVKEKAANELAGDLKVSFETCMNNDLDTPSAIERVFKTVERLHSLHKAGGWAPSRAWPSAPSS